MSHTGLTGQTGEGGQKLRSVPESDESTGVIKHIYMVAARSVETRSEQGAQGAVPKGATEMNCWAIRTGRTEQYVAWKDDLDHVMKINGQEDIETFLAALPPALDDEPNSETAAAKKRHAELLVAWAKLRVQLYDHIKSTLIIEGPHYVDDLKTIRSFEMSNAATSRGCILT